MTKEVKAPLTAANTGPFWRDRRFLVVLTAAFAIPFLIGTFPPLIDLPTHMARYRVGAALAESHDLQRYFTFGWRFLPNLGVDILAIGLAKLIGLGPAVRIVVAAIPALMAGGLLWIAHEAHRRVPATALIALPLAFGYPMTFGFVNACLANALAFIAFALWLRLTAQHRIWQRSLIFACLTPLILTMHILGFLLLGALLTGSTLTRHIQAGASIPRAIGRTALACAPAAWPLAVLILWHTGTAPPPSGWFDWQTKAAWLIGILRDHWAPLDLLSMAIVYGTMLLPVLLPRRFGWLPMLAVPAAMLWIAALLLPTTLITQFASVRLFYLAAAVGVLAVRPIGPLPRIVPSLALGFVLIRLITVSVSTIETNHRLDRELAALDHVARGSRVFALEAVDCARHWAPPRLEHLPSFATVRRDAFVNDQFVTSEGQLMAIRADQPDLQKWTQAVVFTRKCDRWSHRPTLGDALASLPWSQVDYLWLIDVPAALRPARPDLRLLWQQGDSSLYGVVRQPN